MAPKPDDQLRRSRSPGSRSRKSPTLAQGQRTFMFLGSPGSGQGSVEEQRRDVRSFVMMNARRERPWSTRRQSTSAPKPSSRRTKSSSPRSLANTIQSTQGTPGGSQAKEYNSDEYQRTTEVTPSPTISWPQELSDAVCAGEETLVDYWFDVVCPGYSDVDIHGRASFLKHELVPLLHSPAGAHAVLSYSAQSMACRGQNTTSNAIYHKTQAIQALNAALSRSEDYNSDATIFAVFILLCTEERCYPVTLSHDELIDATQQRTMHLNGLKRIIAARGGLVALADNRILQTLLMWHAVSQSVLTLELPWADLQPLQAGFSYDRVTTPSPSSSIMIDILQDSLHVRSEITNLLQDVASYGDELQEWFTTFRPDIDPIALQTWGSFLQYDCVSWHNNNDTEAVSSVDMCLCHSALAYVTKATWNRSRNFEPIQFKILAVLKEHILKTQSEDWSGYPLALLWVLTVGGICAMDGADDYWFAAQFRTICMKLSINSLEALTKHLQNFMWTECRFSDLLYEYWDRAIGGRFYGQHLPSPERYLFKDINASKSPLLDDTEAFEDRVPSARGGQDYVPSTQAHELSNETYHRIVPQQQSLTDDTRYGVIPNTGVILGYAFGEATVRPSGLHECYQVLA